MDVEIKLQGFAELAAALKELPANIGRNALNAAVAAGGRVVRDEAKSRIGTDPKSDTGTLKRSLYVKYIREQSAPHRAVYYVGARQGYNARRRIGSKKVQSGGKFDAYYAKWVELGHWARPKGGGQLKRGRGRTAAIQAAVADGRTKWVPPHPFLRPAFESSKGRAIDAMAAKLRERLERFRVQGK